METTESIGYVLSGRFENYHKQETKKCADLSESSLLCFADLDGHTLCWNDLLAAMSTSGIWTSGISSDSWP